MNIGLYLATVVRIAATDNRLQVRITPQMDGLEITDCPIWPCFFKDEILMAVPGDLVWVISNEEFSTGYILGLANLNTYQDEPFDSYSISKDFKKNINNIYVKLKMENFNFTDLKVTFWNKDCIHFTERSSGGVIYAFASGTFYIFRPDECRLKIGENTIKIDDSGLSLAGKSIRLQSKDVCLGINPNRNVLVTFGTEGNCAEASNYVKA